MVLRVGLRATGKRIKPFITTAGSVAAGKRLAQHPKARAAQACISGAKGEDRKTQIRVCLSRIKKGE